MGEGSSAGKTAIPQAPWAYGLKTQVGEFCKSVFSFSFQCLTFLFAQQARGTFALSNPGAGRPGLLARLASWSHASADGVALWQPAPMLPSETSLSKQARGADGLSVSTAVNVSARGYKSKLL